MPLAGASSESPVGVIRDGHVVSLLPVVSTRSSKGIRWDGLSLDAFQDIPACEIPDHVHPTHMVSLITRGSANHVWTTAGRTRQGLYKPGDPYVVPAGIQDRIAWDRPTSRLLLTLDPQVIAEAFEETAHRKDLEILERWTFKDRPVATVMLAFRADLEDESPAGRLYGESLGLAIAVCLARRYGVPTHEPKHYRGGLPRHRLRLVVDYIQTHLNQDVRLAELTALAGLSPHYCAQLFRQSIGQSAHQYVLAQRIERAKRLLKNALLWHPPRVIARTARQHTVVRTATAQKDAHVGTRPPRIARSHRCCPLPTREGTDLTSRFAGDGDCLMNEAVTRGIRTVAVGPSTKS